MSDYMTRRPECHPLSAAGRKLDRRLRWERMFTVVAMCASFCVVTGAVWYLAIAPVVAASGVEVRMWSGR